MQNPSQPQIPVSDNDDQVHSETVPFNGAWLPDNDPVEIGAGNYKTLENMRYKPGGRPEGIQGCTKINTVAPPGASEDFLLYTEVDVGANRVAVVADSITITGLDQDEDVYVYKDFGANYFDGDFEFQFKINIGVGATGSCYVFGLSNSVKNLYTAFETDNEDGFTLYAQRIAGTDYFYPVIQAYNNGVKLEGVKRTHTFGIDYYIKIKRVESEGTYGTLYMETYTDSGMVTLFHSTSITLTEKANFRYLYAMYSHNNTASGRAVDATISDLREASLIHKAGFHFKKDQPAETHFLAQVEDKNEVSRVFRNTTAIPNQGNFSTTELWTDVSGASRGRFSASPNGMVYCNEKENCVWSGDEMPISGFITLKQITHTRTFSFDQATSTIIDDVGFDFTEAGYKPGQIIDVTGSVSNNKSFTVKSIYSSAPPTNDKMLFAETVTNEAGISCTITARIETGGLKDSSIDYIEAVNNTLQDAGNIALIGGGIDSDTKLLLHCEGSEHGTTFTDSSDSAHTPVANNGAHTIGTQAKFGKTSGFFDRIDDYISVPDHADWFMDAGRVTIDFWVRFDSLSSGQGIFNHYEGVNDKIRFVANPTSSLCFQIVTGGSSVVYVDKGCASKIIVDTWYHIALIRGWGGNDDDWAITLDGEQLGSTVTDSTAWPNHTSDFEIGRYDNAGSGNPPNWIYFGGWIDEFRITKGKARWTENFTPPVKAYRNALCQWLTLSTRPLQGKKYYLSSVNTIVSATTGKVWNGFSFSDLTITDGTKTGSAPNEISLSQDGSMTFDSTVGEAKPLHFKGSYLYAYLFELSAGEAEVYHVTADAPFQPLVNVWDEVFRQAISFQAYLGGAYSDYTVAVSAISSSTSVFGAVISDMTDTEHFIAIFEERMSAFYFTMASGGKVNIINSVIDIEYFDGNDYVSVGQITDGTSGDSNNWKTFGQSGLISFNPAAEHEEFEQTLFGIKGFTYRFTVDHIISVDTTIDAIFGIPAQVTIPPASFPAYYKNRTLLCGFMENQQGNRVDFSAPNREDVWNGALSSMNGLQSLFIGDEADLTCGTQLYNRYGSNVFAFFIFFKNNETYVLSGDNPEDFKIFPVSTVVGCPASETLCIAEAGYEMTEDVFRQIVLWVSITGPMMFDGGVISPILGVETFFDPTSDNFITLSAISDAHGYFDATFKEYNIIFPIDSLWLVYSLREKKWYRKKPAAYPDCSACARDTNGVQYIYAGIDTGYIMRLEDGDTWDGTGIEQVIETGDFSLSKDLWHQTRLRRLKLIMKRLTEDVNLAITHYPDSSSSGTSLTTVDLSPGGSDRIIRDTQPVNQLGWLHRLKFSATTSDTDKGFQPIAWAHQFGIERNDE